MKYLRRRVVFGVSVLTAVLAGYFYFRVPGRSFDVISRLTSENGVVIRKGRINDPSFIEYDLSEAQITLLIDLIEQSSFTRVLSSVVFFNDKDIYDIYVLDDNHERSLLIYSNGGEYIQLVGSRFSGKHLKINNKNWKATLEEILAMPRK